MTLSDICCTEKQARKLNTLISNSDTLFHWRLFSMDDDVNTTDVYARHEMTGIPDDFLSAYTIQEIPSQWQVWANEKWYYLDIGHNFIRYEANDREVLHQIGWKRHNTDRWECENETQARAEMYIYLLENKLIRE